MKRKKQKIPCGQRRWRRPSAFSCIINKAWALFWSMLVKLKKIRKADDVVFYTPFSSQNTKATLTQFLFYFVLFIYSRAQERPTDVHAFPDAGIGERISLQSLLDEAKADRDRPRPLPDWTPNKNLVPKSADEMEKREQSQTGCRMFRRTFGRARPLHATVETKQKFFF